MKKIIIACVLALAPIVGFAATGGFPLDKADINLRDNASLQRGAQAYFNYCYGCHSMKYVRYNRIGQDIGISDAQLKENFIFTDAKVGDQITIATPAAELKKMFGVEPPDLSVIARARGADYIYTYLRSFYTDPKRPWGVNNMVFPDVGMPNVLWELQGVQDAVFKTETDAEGNEHHVFEKFELVKPGTLTPAEYDRLALDLTNFLTYAAEPIRTKREDMGIWVLLFIAVFTGLAYMLKKEFWKDVH